MLSISIPLLKLAGSIVLASALRLHVAVIEETSGAPPGVRIMDYLDAGQVIRLGPRDTIVIGYIKTCWQETITGGMVTIGTEQSEIQGGRVERSKTPCDGGRMLLTSEQANASAAAAFRSPMEPLQFQPRPAFRLYGLSPIVEVKPNGTLVIERVDQPGERHEITFGADWLTHGAFLNLVKVGIVLAPGGIYRARAGEQEMIFQIDPTAKIGETPIIGRLFRLQAAN
jgi:hypothetical protein